MNVKLPEKHGFSKRDKIIYISAIVVCIVAIAVVIYLQMTADTSLLINPKENSDGNVSIIGNKTEEMEESLIANFDTIFSNKLGGSSSSTDIKKLDNNKTLIYSNIEKKEEKEKAYNVDVHIPYINIDNQIIKKYNAEIENVFKAKLDSVLGTQNKNIIYTVEYTANIKDNIISLMIRSNLKEGSSAQRVIIQTYNYDLGSNKELTLQEVLERNGLNTTAVQTKINDEIKHSQEKVEALQNVGYSIYSRDVNSDKYKIENSKEFYISDNTLYIVYAYGNESFTSEMDLVVL